MTRYREFAKPADFPDFLPRSRLSFTLRTFRRDRHLSQADAARDAGLSRNYVAMIERGEERNLSASVIVSLAAVLGITPEDAFRQAITTVYADRSDEARRVNAP